jgi:UDP-2,3-diacylglucosamine hydrolase
MTTLFISDLHLDASRPRATRAFLKFLEDDAPSAQALYILGDLFEVWVGDDDPDPHHREIAAALASLSRKGTRCYFIHGNRDFLIGQRFLAASKLRLLNDPTLIYVGGESVLISHGDILCTDDLSYQRYRRIVRSPLMLTLVNRLPLWAKRRLASKARQKSTASYAFKPPEILDVNQAAVVTALAEYKVSTLLHGHTHRPAIHEMTLQGLPARRIVLGDWYEAGSVLSWDVNGPQLNTLSF